MVKLDQITSSRDAYEILKPLLADLPKEEFWVLFLNRSNKIMAKDQVSSGGVNGTVADPRIIFKKALDHLASGIILAHNHPSGTLRPSREDDIMTKKLVEAGRLLEIPILDHLIITDNGYFSYADEGRL